MHTTQTFLDILLNFLLCDLLSLLLSLFVHTIGAVWFKVNKGRGQISQIAYLVLLQS